MHWIICKISENEKSENDVSKYFSYTLYATTVKRSDRCLHTYRDVFWCNDRNRAQEEK